MIATARQICQSGFEGIENIRFHIYCCLCSSSYLTTIVSTPLMNALSHFLIIILFWWTFFFSTQQDSFSVLNVRSQKLQLRHNNKKSYFIAKLWLSAEIPLFFFLLRSIVLKREHILHTAFRWSFWGHHIETHGGFLNSYMFYWNLFSATRRLHLQSKIFKIRFPKAFFSYV